MQPHSLIRRWLQVAAGLALLAVAAAAQSSAPPPMAAGNAFFVAPGTRDAMLNGQPLLPGTAVLAGETITTSRGGVVVLTPTHGAGGAILVTGNASVTVRPGAVGAGGTDQLQINQGNARITGAVTVMTPQGQVFTPAGAGASYVVNTSLAQSSMGVLTGNVATFNPGVSSAPALSVAAGQAIEVATINGQIRFRSIDFTRVHQPSASDSVPQTVAASQSQ